MSDILKEIAQLERELGCLPPCHSREDFFNSVPRWMQYPDEDIGEDECKADEDWVTENADSLWLEQLKRLKKMKDSQPVMWSKMINFD